MDIRYGQGKSGYGTGVSIELTGDEVARAIDAYLVAHGVHVQGPRTIRMNGERCLDGQVYVDPKGFVIDPEGRRFDGSRPADGGASRPAGALG